MLSLPSQSRVSCPGGLRHNTVTHGYIRIGHASMHLDSSAQPRDATDGVAPPPVMGGAPPINVFNDVFEFSKINKWCGLSHIPRSTSRRVFARVVFQSVAVVIASNATHARVGRPLQIEWEESRRKRSKY